MQQFPSDILELIRIQLEKEKRTLEFRIDELTKQDPFSDPDRLSDNAASDRDADEESSHDRYAALIAQLRDKRTALDDALARVSDGTYGFCSICQNMIDTDRLMILPTAIVCKSCEDSRERK